MLGFLIGLVAGGIVGVVVMALMNIAAEADQTTEKHREQMLER